MMGFETSEFQARVARAQAAMAKAGIDALFLTTEPQIRYFTGYLTRFWESPARPWYVIVPAAGDPVAVIPSIGAELMAKTWVSDIRTWSSPDFSDDGVGLLKDTLQELCGEEARIGIPSGYETHMRMPLNDFNRLNALLPKVEFGGDENIVQQLRMIKSEAEIDKIRNSCAIAGRAFARVPDIAGAGVPLETVFRKFQMLCLEEGADWVGYLAGGAGQGGYDDVISPAAATPLIQGDVLMLDTGVVRDGYYSDFDRNYTVGPASSTQHDAYQRLLEATELGKMAARAGNVASDVFHAMLPPLGGVAAAETAGRIGHGLGMNLTEWPSFTAGDDTPLSNGMVITIEPGIPLNGGPGIMVHEDVFVIREGGVEQLSPKAPDNMIEV